jgi:hypothetical protein
VPTRPGVQGRRTRTGRDRRWGPLALCAAGAAWLRAGEALSAGWLAATGLGVSVLPMSAAVEVPATRAALRRLLSGLGEPYLVLRLGIADPDSSAPGTPRLPVERILP